MQTRKGMTLAAFGLAVLSLAAPRAGAEVPRPSLGGGGTRTVGPMPGPGSGSSPASGRTTQPAASDRTGQPNRPAPRSPSGSLAGRGNVARVSPLFTPRPYTVPRPQYARIFIPGALPRCTVRPDAAFWGGRDLFGEIQRMARRGYIPVLPAGNLPTFQGWTWFPAGWIAYAFVVPPGEKLHVRLHHPNEGWFRLLLVDSWGQRRFLGALQNVIPTGNPEVFFTNKFAEPKAVYVIVDDPGWMSDKVRPYTLNVDRSWDPGKLPAPEVPKVLGIWAQGPAVEDKGEAPAKG